MSMRRAPSCTQPLQERSGPRGARSTRGPADSVAVVIGSPSLLLRLGQLELVELDLELPRRHRFGHDTNFQCLGELNDGAEPTCSCDCEPGFPILARCKQHLFSPSLDPKISRLVQGRTIIVSGCTPLLTAPVDAEP